LAATWVRVRVRVRVGVGFRVRAGVELRARNRVRVRMRGRARARVLAWRRPGLASPRVPRRGHRSPRGLGRGRCLVISAQGKARLTRVSIRPLLVEATGSGPGKEAWVGDLGRDLGSRSAHHAFYG
jgi:hypothetical protein